MGNFNRLPLTALRTFEAAARLRSFKKAAQELFVTPTAVSHQIRQLEKDLSLLLFTRLTRKVVLTEAGEELARTIATAFKEIADGLERLPSRNRQRIDVALGSIVAARWLTPRLSNFWRDLPSCDLRLHHTPLVVDPDRDEFDIAIARRSGPWTGFQADPFLRVHVTPVVSPQLLADLGELEKVEDLARFPIIQHRDGDDWATWLQGSPLPDLDGNDPMVIEDANVALQAAINGQGVALGILEFVGDDLAAGRLLAPLKRTVELPRPYQLLVRRRALKLPHVAAVHAWLKAAAESDN